MGNKEISVWEEHQFWLEILQDHAVFVRNFLGAEEDQLLNEANKYIELFQQLRNTLTTIDPQIDAGSDIAIQFAQQAYPVAHGYYTLEGHIQSLRISNEVVIHLSPTYFNGTLNENEEYLRQLSYYVKGEKPPLLHLVDLLDLWLEDQLGHAALLIEALDLIETILVEELRKIKSLFQAHMVKNEAMKGYLRFKYPGFPAQEHFAREVSVSVNAFNQIVKDVITMYKNDTVLDQTTLRFLEHHLPEACYFLKKLNNYVPQITFPSCNLTKPTY